MTTARSVCGSVPTILAVAFLPLAKITRTVSPCGGGDHVVVGQDVAVGAEDHARALAAAVVIETTLSCTAAAIFGRSALLITGAAE